MIRALTENVWWKLLSIAIAFVLWARYSAQSEIGTSMPVAIQYRNLPPNLEITDDLGLDRVYLKVRGPAGSLSPASLAAAAIVLDMEGVDRPGERTFALSESNVQLPSGVKLMRAVPSQIHLKFETRISKVVPVEPRFRSSAPPGYRVVSQQVIPERVRIVGPQTRVSAITTMPSDPIDLSNTFGDAEFRVSANLQDPFVRLDQAVQIVVRVKLEKSAK